MAAEDQPQRARGRARVVAKRPTATIALSRGDEIGFAIGAMNAAGFAITATTPRRLTVTVGRRRLSTVAKALRAVGFTIDDGAER